MDILYLVCEGYHDYIGSNTNHVGVFTSIELATQMIEKILPYLEKENHIKYVKNNDNYWEMDNYFIDIEEIELDMNYIPSDYLPRTPNK